MRRKRMARLLRKLRAMCKSLPKRDQLLLRIGADCRGRLPALPPRFSESFSKRPHNVIRAHHLIVFVLQDMAVPDVSPLETFKLCNDPGH